MANIPPPLLHVVLYHCTVSLCCIRFTKLYSALPLFLIYIIPAPITIATEPSSISHIFCNAISPVLGASIFGCEPGSEPAVSVSVGSGFVGSGFVGSGFSMSGLMSVFFPFSTVSAITIV